MRGNPDWAAVDAAIGDGAEAAFSFLERLVASPSTVGREQDAQQIVAAEVGRLGFEATELPVPADTADAAPGGVAQASYAGRPNVLGRINPGGSPSLLLNGHVDVVPRPSTGSGRPSSARPRTIPGWPPTRHRCARPGSGPRDTSSMKTTRSCARWPRRTSGCTAPRRGGW